MKKMAIERLQMGDVTVFFSFFTPEEQKLRQIDAQSAAVRRIIRHATGKDREVLHDEDCAPRLKDYAGHISVSHCEGAAAVGFHATERIGIDIERPRAQLPRVKHKFLSPAEMEKWDTLDALLTAWTIKEAAYKAAGVRGLPLVEGINIKNSGSVEVTPPEGKLMAYSVHSVTRDDVRITAVSRIIP